MSNPNPPAPAVPAPRWFVVLALLALAAYGIFLGRNSTVAAGGSDSSGYLNSAHLIASGHLAGELRVPAEFGPVSELNRMHFTPYGFYPTLEGTVLPPTYPPGLPLQFAAAGKLLGWHYGVLFIDLASALTAVWLCYLAARELNLSPFLAAAGATALALCPIFIFTSIQPLSDTPATTWSLAAVFAALRARRHLGWAVACGALFSIAVLVRPTNAVVLAALLVFLGPDWRRLGLLVVGGIPGAAWLGFYNYTLYGHPFRSGYGAIYEAFDVVYIPGALVDFAHWLALLLPAVFLVLPLAIPFEREFRTRIVAAIAVWWVAVIVLFACVVFSHESWWSLRYLLPSVPALILGALLGLDALVRRLPAARRPLLLHASAAVLFIWAVAGSVYWTKKLGVLYIPGYENVYTDASLAAQKALPPNSLVVCSSFCGALYAYTNFPILRSELIDTAQFAHFAALAAKSGRPVCAVVFEAEEKNTLHERCPGEWTRVGSLKNVSFWRLTGPAAVSAAK
ncbi:MAG: glycosyltransferase family 39 protein [Verrucomicrobia bacterium]|nr:glycosyltransferase family 39 protein [Verrucomicrobiota bacterium]